MALFILRIKEVVPLHQPNKDIANFFHYDVKLARDYNKTIHEGDLQSDNLARSIVNRWKTFKSLTSHDIQQHQETGQSLSINTDVELTDTKTNNVLNIDIESRRKLIHLNTFAKEYNLDVFDKRDYDLFDSDSREKVRLLVSDLIDICQEEIPNVFVDLFHIQSCGTQTSTDKEHRSFYEELIELLPPKWYQLFIREQQRRQIMSWSSSFNRTYSLRVPRLTTFRKSISESNENHHSQSVKKPCERNTANFRRQSSVPESILHSLSIINQETETPVLGTRFRIARPSTTTEMFSNE